MSCNAYTVLLCVSLCSAIEAQKAPDRQAIPVSDVPVVAAKPQIPFAGVLHLELEARDLVVHAYMNGLAGDFVGIVLLSDSPAQTHFLTGLPPILSNFVVLGIGAGHNGELDLRRPNPLASTLADLGPLFGQALALDESGLAFGGVVPLSQSGCRPAIHDASEHK